jgi:hypothetical protein
MKMLPLRSFTEDLQARSPHTSRPCDAFACLLFQSLFAPLLVYLIRPTAEPECASCQHPLRAKKIGRKEEGINVQSCKEQSLLIIRQDSAMAVAKSGLDERLIAACHIRPRPDEQVPLKCIRMKSRELLLFRHFLASCFVRPNGHCSTKA